MIKIHLSRILGERKMSQRDLAKKTGIRPNTISAMYHETIKRLDIDILDKICEVLDIQVSDLIEYVPDNLTEAYLAESEGPLTPEHRAEIEAYIAKLKARRASGIVTAKDRPGLDPAEEELIRRIIQEIKKSQ